jgi:hypothetical protein
VGEAEKLARRFAERGLAVAWKMDFNWRFRRESKFSEKSRRNSWPQRYSRLPPIAMVGRRAFWPKRPIELKLIDSMSRRAAA